MLTQLWSNRRLVEAQFVSSQNEVVLVLLCSNVRLFPLNWIQYLHEKAFLSTFRLYQSY